MDLSPVELIVFLLAGFVTGIINVLAGGGSVITLPIFMILCGLPAPIANGTNRVGVLIHGTISTLAFRKSDQVDFKMGAWVLIPAVIGAIIGANVAVDTDEQLMRQIIIVMMLLMLGVILFNPSAMLREHNEPRKSPGSKLLLIVIFGAIGFYGGFIQAGVGILILVAQVTIARYTLLQSNAIKMLMVALYSIPVLIIFALNDQVHWGYGLTMAVSQSAGALVGARFALRFPKANVWIRYLLILIIVVSVLKLSGLVEGIV